MAAVRQQHATERTAERAANAAKVRRLGRVSAFSDLPADTFSTIVMDPPWDWGDEGDADQFGRARPRYATMPLDKVAALDVARVAGADPVQAAVDREWGGYTGYFGDPDGFRWEIAWNPGPIGQSVLPG
jgi:hypothetical protein